MYTEYITSKKVYMNEEETEDLNEEKEQRAERENYYREAALYPSE